ncbi:hypothetical protein FRX31_015561 [Thalictrum thalictroides]|uniref:Heavy metal-associated isoprenylated plant protein n=1 Tax=Thalictrum thalictroides TaxID=46969 RepID=A0A7J6WEN0_THATH|nr:hypothetical protein FRX31_015561 [Thalictrum thalictroides]
MSEQISTLVIKVDLGCQKCYKKIREVLCKYHCQIQSKTFDEKNNIVIVTGWFHPCKFSKKLRCKAGYPPWYEGYGGAQCYEGYGMPVVPVSPPYQYPSKPPICHEPAPPPVYDCYYGRPPPCSCGCGGYRRCGTMGYYFTEENPTTCSIM